MPNYGKMADGLWHPGNLSAREVDGSWHPLAPSVHEADGNWHAAASPLTLTSSVPGVSIVSGLNGTITTPSLTVTAANGTGPYTYAWTIEPGTDVVTINSPTATTTAFSVAYPFVVPPKEWNSVARCTVTDHIGNTAYCLVFIFIDYEKFF